MYSEGSRTYFAAQETKELVADLDKMTKQKSEFIDQSGLRMKWQNAYKLYFGKHFNLNQPYDDKNIIDLGETGELKGVPVNHFRNFVNHILSLTTSQKPSWQCRAINSDLKSLQQAKLGNCILDAFFVGKRVLRQYKRAAEFALLFGKGYVKTIWEKDAGKPYTMEEVENDLGETHVRNIYEGDVVVTSLSPFDYYTDMSLDKWEDRSWEITRTFKNKYDLAARYPEKANDLIGINSSVKDSAEAYKWWMFVSMQTTDLIPVFEFYHKRTDAMPNGRYTLYCNKDVVLYDGPIPYEKLPVDRIVSGELHGTVEGYSDCWDLMALQEAYNVVYSSVYTNLQAHAVQSILIPRTCNLGVDQISKGLSGLKYDPQGGKPEPLQLVANPPDAIPFIQLTERAMETISGVNSVARGNPEQSLKSGVALSLVQSMAVQYASKFQESWAILLEDGGTKIFDLLKQFANTQRMVEMQGKFNKGRSRPFDKNDIQSIQRVVIELGNPMTRTTAGRVQIATDLMQNGLITSPQQYLQVMETGNLETLTEGPEAQLDLIRSENELLQDGMFDQVRVLVGDKHLLHMQEHLALLSNPMIRANEEIVGQILSHIQEHKGLYQTQEPIWSQIAGDPPNQTPPPPEGAQGPEAMPPELVQNQPVPGSENLPQGAPLPPQAAPQPIPGQG